MNNTNNDAEALCWKACHSLNFPYDSPDHNHLFNELLGRFMVEDHLWQFLHTDDYE